MTIEAHSTAKAGDIAVLIVNWNTCDLLERCLASIEACPERDQLDAVVIDNGSHDGSAQMVRERFPQCTLIETGENLGFASANNLGFRASSAPFVLLLNSDTEVRPGTIARCRDHLVSHPTVGAVGCRIEYPDGRPQNSVFREPSLRGIVSTTLGLAQRFPTSRVFNHDRYGRWHPRTTTQVEVVMGSFLMVRRSDMTEDRILDDGFFMYAEEADLCASLRARGLTIDFLPEATVTHIQGASSRTPEQLAWSDEAKRRAALRFLRKWRPAWQASVANLVMMAGLAPRAMAWAISDSSRGTQRLLKAQSLRFHLGALRDPSTMDERFGPPPEATDASGA